MQHADSWAPVAAAVGERYPVTLCEFETWTYEERLAEIRRAGEGRVIVGYSMGGRLALHAAVRWSFAGVATVGASAGIDDETARAARRAADDELAGWIEAHTVEEVVARWERNPVFASQPPDLVAGQRQARLDHDPSQLARLLRSAGQGTLEPIWDSLEQIDAPILAIAGAQDRNYAGTARRIADTKGLPATRMRLVEGCGHAAHLERPDAVASALLDWLELVH